MLGRKNKIPPEQGRARRSPAVSQPTRPAFSYYSSSRQEQPVQQQRRNSSGHADATQKGSFNAPRLTRSQLPYWLFVGVLLVCAVKLLLLSTSPKVIVLGNSGTATTYSQPTSTYADAARKLLAGSILNHTKLTANVTGTAQTLEKQFPELESVALNVPLIGNRPLLYVQVAPPSVILQTSHGNYALNQSGIVLAHLQAQPARVPQVQDQSGVTPEVGHQFLPGSTIAFLQTVQYQLAAAKIQTSAFVLPAHNPYELDSQLEGKPYTLRFNLQADVREQSGAVVAVLQRGDVTPQQYVDARATGRVFYK